MLCARFSVYMPASPAVALLHGSRTSADSSTPRILLVEDEASVARYLSELFEARGFRVERFSHGTEALQSFAANPSAFDLVLTDQVMPVGSGLELATDMLGIRPDLPVIVLTGDPDQISDADIVSSGIKAVLGKPIQSEHLLAKVRSLIGSMSRSEAGTEQP